MVITSISYRTCLSLLYVLSFFLQLNKPQKKSSLSLSLSLIYTTREKKKKTKVFKALQNAFVVVVVALIFLIFDHLWRAREKEREET